MWNEIFVNSSLSYMNQYGIENLNLLGLLN